ncbi:ABC transporter permease [Thermosulfurimonas sp. F29]|uniref:cell division protein FtsX n=1 Tax=Thermosulfurimonas sp. F29 TaxID=2867247 RepID=UPI001C828CAE|nr:permease-like cell division protein FtsX [Thermosulfurimonas sp. F29]MBX6423505.1 permease-like cell division protein FtsX [Thermosulfurimonas sp. F29]
MLRRLAAELKLNRGTYLMTLFILASSVAVLLFFAFLYYNIYIFSQKTARSLALTVYLKPDLNPAEEKRILRRLKALPGVREVRLVPREEVLRELKKIFRENPEILEELDLSRLPPFFEVIFENPLRDLERARGSFPEIERLPGVLKIRYAESWLGRIYHLAKLIKRLTILSGALLLASLAFLMGITIHYGLEKQKEEIEILSLLGATPGYISRPKVAVGFLVGFGAALMALGILAGLKTYLDQMLLGLWPFVDFRWKDIPLKYLILGAGGVGLFSALVSWFSVRRYFS